MDSREYEELTQVARQVGGLAAALLEGAAEQDVDLRRAVRNLPAWGTAFMAGAGVVAGYWLARRQTPRQSAPTPAEAARALLQDAGETAARRFETFLESQPSARSIVETVLPQGLDVDSAGAKAQAWIDQVAEPGLRDGLQSVSRQINQGRLGSWLRQAGLTGETESGNDGDDKPPMLPG